MLSTVSTREPASFWRENVIALSCRHSTTSFGLNVVAAERSHNIKDVLSFCNQTSA